MPFSSIAFTSRWVGSIGKPCGSRVTGLSYRDTQCGFKISRADVARVVSTRQPIEGFGFYIARKRAFRILESTGAKFNAEGTKVGL